MAIDPNPFICDICGTHKKETNHWWLGYVNVNGVEIVKWDELTAKSYDLAHLCGIGCATTWAGQQLVKFNP